jgi:hypothetical protein
MRRKSWEKKRENALLENKFIKKIFPVRELSQNKPILIAEPCGYDTIPVPVQVPTSYFSFYGSGS